MSNVTSEIEAFKVVFPKSLLICISQFTNKRIDIHNRENNANIPHTVEGEIMIVLGVMLVRNHVPNQSDFWSLRMTP